MGDLMPYAKSWTDKYNDEWYLGLSLTERGMWDQLFTWAKLHGDTGKIFLTNMVHAGSVFGCDRKTAGRILGKFHDNSRIELSDSQAGINIDIANYEYYQRVKRVGDSSISGDIREKSKKNPPIIRADKSREDKSNIPYVDIVNDLNEITKKKYPSDPVSPKTKGFIQARWNDGYRLDDFKYVHRIKMQDMKAGEFAEKWLRPETLYGNKFEGYRQQTNRPGKPDQLSLAGGHPEAGPVGGQG